MLSFLLLNDTYWANKERKNICPDSSKAERASCMGCAGNQRSVLASEQSRAHEPRRELYGTVCETTSWSTSPQMLAAWSLQKVVGN